MRVCNRCGKEQPLTDFYKQKAGRGGYRSICKTCMRPGVRASAARSRQKNRESRSQKSYAYNIKCRYGLSWSRYQEMVMLQCGLCCLCGKDPEERRLVVDHCHTTGRVRGLICPECNSALGLVRDDTEILSRMIDYLGR